MRAITVVALVLVCTFPIAWADKNATSNLSSQQTAAIEKACTDLVLDYAYHRDRPDPDALGELFTRDATMEILGNTIAGRDAIRERVALDENATVFRHLMSNIRIFPVDASHARGVSYVQVYGGQPSSGPTHVDTFLAIGEYHDDFVLTDAGWKIKHRRFVMVFSPQE